MMSTRLFTLLFLISFKAFSIEFNLEQQFQYQSFEEAESAQSFLRYSVKSTKVGIFTSTVPGYVKKFKAMGQMDYAGFKAKKLMVQFPVLEMDSDNEDRDTKLHNLCLSHDKFPNITLTVNEDLEYSNELQKVKGIINVRGKDKPIELMIKVYPKGHLIIAEGSTIMSLKELEIPDPSIAVATLSDDIKVEFKIIHQRQR